MATRRTWKPWTTAPYATSSPGPGRSRQWVGVGRWRLPPQRGGGVDVVAQCERVRAGSDATTGLRFGVLAARRCRRPSTFRTRSGTCLALVHEPIGSRHGGGGVRIRGWRRWRLIRLAGGLQILLHRRNHAAIAVDDGLRQPRRACTSCVDANSPPSVGRHVAPVPTVGPGGTITACLIHAPPMRSHPVAPPVNDMLGAGGVLPDNGRS